MTEEIVEKIRGIINNNSIRNKSQGMIESVQRIAKMDQVQERKRTKRLLMKDRDLFLIRNDSVLRGKKKKIVEATKP